MIAQRRSQPLPTIISDGFGGRVDARQAGDLVQISVVKGAREVVYSLLQTPDVVECAIFGETPAANDRLQPVGVPVHPRRWPEVPDEPVRGLEPRGDVDLIHPSLRKNFRR